ncbi:MAG TPA: hypothetical protein VLM89_02700, partial [Phycisphaerae bacterium]|nr:hypothetical protein [Phycisphaerae bacterium]
MVSVAVLVGLLAMVAMIFSTSTRASGQAQTTTALYRVVQQAAEAIRQDLEATVPGESIMGIARVDILAQATPEAAEAGLVPNPAAAGNWHRADMLMLVHRRKFSPYIFEPQDNDAFEEYRHVVYGHANIGRLAQTGPNTYGWVLTSRVEPWSDPAAINTVAAMPASKWHLARRVTGSPTIQTLNDTSGPDS